MATCDIWGSDFGKVPASYDIYYMIEGTVKYLWYEFLIWVFNIQTITLLKTIQNLSQKLDVIVLQGKSDCKFDVSMIFSISGELELYESKGRKDTIIC